MKFFLLLAGLAFAMGACPNACSGHGTCGLSSKCTCQARWVGNDCSQRECPSGLSWIVTTSDSSAKIPAGGDLGGYHPYAECSNRGTCDRDSGECQCTEGYEGRGCRRTSCPNACSGHGFCRYNSEVNSNYKGLDKGARVKFGDDEWDAGKTRQCVCDRGYEGIDCSSRICPKGDDPLTQCNTTPGNSVNDVQHIELKTGGSYGADKFFSITFTDMYNGVYTTRPIHTDFDSTAKITAWAADVKAALEELPNFAIPKVDVCGEKCLATTPSCTKEFAWTGDDAADKTLCEALTGTWTAGSSSQGCCTGAHATDSLVASVTFVDAANSGEQQLMKINDGVADNNKAWMQPRFATAGGADKMRVVRKGVLAANKHEEHIECSNRGTCDGDTGLCQCFEGFTGEACHEQTVFF